MATTIDEMMTRRPRLEFAVELTPARIEEFWKRGFIATKVDRIVHFGSSRPLPFFLPLVWGLVAAFAAFLCTPFRTI